MLVAGGFLKQQRPKKNAIATAVRPRNATPPTAPPMITPEEGEEPQLCGIMRVALAPEDSVMEPSEPTSNGTVKPDAVGGIHDIEPETVGVPSRVALTVPSPG